MAQDEPLRFFLDNCVPDSVGRTLRDAGHEVIFQRDALATDAPDLLVALTSAENQAILLTFDKDHKAIASRLSISHGRLRTLSRIDFNCGEPIAAKRVKEGLSFIEHEWRLCQAARDRRMFIKITNTTFVTTR